MVPRKHSPIVAMVCLMLSLLLATWANADTEILLGIKDQHINADDVCRAHLQAAAITASQFWDTTRPDSDIIEGFLPAVNTPCAYNPHTETFWVRALMPDDYADSFIAVMALYPEVAGSLLQDVIVMRPVLNTVTGEYEMPEEPTWTLPVVDEQGNQIGEQQVYVGRFAR